MGSSFKEFILKRDEKTHQSLGGNQLLKDISCKNYIIKVNRIKQHAQLVVAIITSKQTKIQCPHLTSWMRFCNSKWNDVLKKQFYHRLFDINKS